MKRVRIIDPPSAVIRTKFTVTLTEEERTDLNRLVTTGRRAARTIRHAPVLLTADVGSAGPRWPDAQIREAFALGFPAITRIRRRFVADGLDAAVQRRAARTPRLRTLDGRAEAHLVALACSAPPAGRDRWTLEVLTDRFLARGVSPPVSDETVRRTLQQPTSRPG